MDRIGRYKIVRELGRGAMGVVYHAVDPNIGRPVAVKTIQLGGSSNSEERQRMRDRLFREARSAGMLSHPGIVTIYDVDQQGDLAYIAMEYVDGETLNQVLSQPHPLAPDQMFGILSQTAAALDYAHQKGIVHRDVKPANIMIEGPAGGHPGAAKIADFGIAKITASDQLTMTGTIVGTPHYMSPEQVQGLAIDGRSDQFSLAVIAFEMLTGEKPYTGEHLTTVVYKIVAEDPPPAHRLNQTLSSAIENVLKKGLAKKPDERYPTCQAFVQALEAACAASKGWKAMPRGGSLNEPTMVDAPHPGINLPPPRRPRLDESMADAAPRAKPKSRFLPFLLAILVVAGLLALIGSQAINWLSHPAVPPPETAAQQEKSPPPAPAVAPAASSQNPGEVKPSPMPQASVAQNSPPPAAPGSGQTAAATAPATPDSATPEKTADKTDDTAAPARRAVPQPVQIVSSPGGALATLDGNSDQSCTTPCSLKALPGWHSLTVEMQGYPAEHRQVQVGTGPLELPAVVMHAPMGTLMLTSEPVGAVVLVNGKATSQTTPAQLRLAPGTYQIGVSKDGVQGSSTVDIHNGETELLKILLGP